MDEPDPRGPRGLEPAAAGKQSPRVRLADLGDDERADDRWQDPQAGLGEPEPRATLGDDDVGDGAQAHPSTECRAVDSGDDRHRAGIDRLEHVGHRHRVLLVALDAERHRRSHPAEVRTGAERRSVAREHDRAQPGRALAREGRERLRNSAMSDASNALWISGRGEGHARDDVSWAGRARAGAMRSTWADTYRMLTIGSTSPEVGGSAPRHAVDSPQARALEVGRR